MPSEPTPLPADVAAVERALDRLRQPTTVHDRLAILQRLVEFWHGPIRPEDGMSEGELTGIPIPLPLRWWYRWAGKRSEILSKQNWLFIPHDWERKRGQLTIKNGRLFFYAENQGVYQWSTLPQGDDPPVFGRYEGRGRWAKEGVTLSEHLILACLFEAVMCHAKYEASAAWLKEQKLDEMSVTFRRSRLGRGGGWRRDFLQAAEPSCVRVVTRCPMARRTIRFGSALKRPSHCNV